MRKTNKKGFTIVELVIVIAVIAILAAVLIPTFISLTKKANQSADIQAVRQMNTALAMKQATDVMDITKVYEALEEASMSTKDYRPLTADAYFFWYSEDNRVVYVDDNYTVIYPDEYKGKNAKTDFNGKLLSLTTEIKGDSTYSKDETNGTITVSSGAQLYQAIQDLATSDSIKLKADGSESWKFQHAILKNTTIKLSQNIDMMGAALDIGYVASDVTLTIDGAGYTILNISNLENAVDNAKLNAEGIQKNYYCGLVQYLAANSTVVFKDLKLNGVVVGNKDTNSSGILVGNAQSNATIEIDGVEIVNATLYGGNKLGAFIGAQYSGGCNVTVKKGTNVTTKLENVNIVSYGGESGILFGSTDNGGTLISKKMKIDKNLFGANGDISFIKNCTVKCVSTDVKAYKNTDTTKFNDTLDKNVAQYKSKWRATTAYLGFAGYVGGKTTFPESQSTFNPINTYEQAVTAGWIWDFGNSKAVTE